MAFKSIVLGLQSIDNTNHAVKFSVKFVDIVNLVFDTDFVVSVPWSTFTDTQSLSDALQSAILTEATNRSYAGFSASDILWFAPDVLNKDALTKTPSAASRSLNSAFQISSTKSARVSYSVDVATTLNLSGGAAGTVTLQYADDSGFTTNVVTVQGATSGNTGTLTLGLALTQTTSATLAGFIPAGKYVRLATANTTGTPTFTFRNGQEVLEN